MRPIPWLLMTTFTVLTVVTACTSAPPPRHDNDKTRSHADDAQRDLEREEQSRK